ncbi:MAG TPA: hypothetical protein VF423_09585 [Actinomycetes bacterium]
MSGRLAARHVHRPAHPRVELLPLDVVDELLGASPVQVGETLDLEDLQQGSTTAYMRTTTATTVVISPITDRSLVSVAADLS